MPPPRRWELASCTFRSGRPTISSQHSNEWSKRNSTRSTSLRAPLPTRTGRSLLSLRSITGCRRCTASANSVLRWPPILWSQPVRRLSTRSSLRRQDSQGIAAVGFAGGATDPLRAGHQRENSQSAWRRCAAHATRAGRRGDRIRAAMSAIGPKRTSVSAPHMSAFGGKADMTVCGNPLSRSL
jgi:hypothetical protein